MLILLPNFPRPIEVEGRLFVDVLLAKVPAAKVDTADSTCENGPINESRKED